MTRVVGEVRGRRPLPGSRQFFEAKAGPAMLVPGTRKGATFARGRNPAHYLIVPLDIDPLSVSWPVADHPGLLINRVDAPDAFVSKLVQALIQDRAPLVVVIGDDVPTSIHKRISQPSA